MMKRQLIIVISLVFGLLTGETLAQQTRVIQILAGHQKIIAVPANARIAIGDRSIAMATPRPNQREIVITGHRAGVTSLTISSRNGERVEERIIRVLQKNPHTVLAEIRDIFGEVEGITFSARQGEVVAEGAVYTQADLEKFQAILKRYPHIINRVEDKSEKLMIHVSVEVIEIVRTKGTDYNNGPLPPNTGSFFSQAGSKPQWAFGVEAGLLQRLAYWKSAGIAKVIANPTLTVTNGDTATFLAGGEVPVPVPAGIGVAAIEYKEFGVRLEVAPEITGSGKIMLDIMAEVSSIDFSGQDIQTGAPRLFTRRVSSRSLVNENDTVALAGIYQRMIVKNRRRVPILGHLLPFIFSSVREIEEIKELVVLVTPKTPVEFDIKEYPLMEKELQNLRRGR
jgi:pilus assembly protein CpaC